LGQAAIDTMQLEFTFRDPSVLHRELEQRSGLRVQLVVTDNSHTVMSVKHHPVSGVVALRMHHMFLGADGDVLKALAAWLRKPSCRRSGDVIDRFIRENRHLVRRQRGVERRLHTAGVVYDLRTLFDEVNAAHFGGSVTAAITWGRRPNSKRRRSIRFGSYSVEEHLIRIHPYLDNPRVPEFFVRYIVYHEMLHAHLGIEESATGRRRIHTAEFKRIERAYPDYSRAEAWQAKTSNLRMLLR
jgi:predicted SprT family Zn-dependent metalloprotease